MTKASEPISRFLTDRIDAGDFPSAVYLVAENSAVVFEDALGEAVVSPKRIEAEIDTIYDLASLTKPLITTLLLARMIERGELSLDDLVSTHLVEFNRDDKRAITLRHLLTHTSGLPAWRPLYLLASREAIVELIATKRLEFLPGSRVRYSDLGFIALGSIIERLHNATEDEIAARVIFVPLGLNRTHFNPPSAIRELIAASEFGNLHERATCASLGYKDGQFRDELIWGEVHDGNAYFLGGVAGHAGLFSTARETLRMASQFIASTSQLLSPTTCEMFRTNLTEGFEEARSIGWQLASTPDSTAGPALAADSFGHLGFTGTSCWIDPSRERVFILLTNRTHDHTLPFVNINSVRRRFHFLAVEQLEAR